MNVLHRLIGSIFLAGAITILTGCPLNPRVPLGVLEVFGEGICYLDGVEKGELPVRIPLNEGDYVVSVGDKEQSISIPPDLPITESLMDAMFNMVSYNNPVTMDIFGEVIGIMEEDMRGSITFKFNISDSYYVEIVYKSKDDRQILSVDIELEF